MIPIVFRAGRVSQEFTNGFVFVAGLGGAAPEEEAEAGGSAGIKQSLGFRGPGFTTRGRMVLRPPFQRTN